MPYIAIHVVARYTSESWEEREAMEAKIIAALGCDNTEPDCPMEFFASTVVETREQASAWLIA